MSVNSEIYWGYTVELEDQLTDIDFDKYHEFIELHPEYNRYNDKNTVQLVIDGMGGEYVRLIYVIEHIKDFYKDFFYCAKTENEEYIYNELNKAYRMLENKDLDKSLIKLAFWSHFS